MTTRDRIEEILRPAIDTKAPYAKVMIDQLCAVVEPVSDVTEAGGVCWRGRFLTELSRDELMDAVLWLALKLEQSNSDGLDLSRVMSRRT